MIFFSTVNKDEQSVVGEAHTTAAKKVRPLACR
jgi:hypothetical protein